MPTIAPTKIVTGTYTVDPAHSNVGFAVRHMGISTVRGQFNNFQGTIESADGKLKLSGTVETASVDTGEEKRDGHLQSPDFFDAANFPQITFDSDTVESIGGDKVKLTGDITIHGVTKPVDLTGEISEAGQDPWGNDRIGFEVEGKIDRRDFGLTWNQALAAGNLLVSNDVKLVVAVSAIKAA